MSVISIVQPRSGRARRIGFSTLVNLIKSHPITSLADSDGFIELGLSGSMNIRFESGADGGPVQVSLFSTLNIGDVPPARLQLINENEEPAAALIERRLFGLRQVYAITLLLDTGRGAALSAALLENPDMDLEQSLLDVPEQLYLREAGAGSWWVVALTKVRGAPEKALNGLALFFGDGRSLLLDRVRAGTKMKHQEVARLQDQRILELAKALDKIKDPNGRAAIRHRLKVEMNLTNPALAAPAIAGLLPAPEHKHQKRDPSVGKVQRDLSIGKVSRLR